MSDDEPDYDQISTYPERELKSPLSTTIRANVAEFWTRLRAGKRLVLPGPIYGSLRCMLYWVSILVSGTGDAPLSASEALRSTEFIIDNEHLYPHFTKWGHAELRNIPERELVRGIALELLVSVSKYGNEVTGIIGSGQESVFLRGSRARCGAME
jgi:hypothetical protein